MHPITASVDPELVACTSSAFHSSPLRPKVGALTCVVVLALSLAACTNGGTSGSTANQLVTQGLAAEQGGNLNQAFSDYQAAVTKDPNNKYAHYDLGYIYQQRNDTQDATTEYDKVLQLDPTFTRAIYNLAVLEAPTDPSGAIALYKQDLQLDSTNASANFNLGVLLVKEGQVPQGQSYIQIALRLNPALASDLPPGVTP
jgi:tetratricopeptide (TPR) repeat protein